MASQQATCRVRCTKNYATFNLHRLETFLLSSLNQMRNDGLFCDVTLVNKQDTESDDTFSHPAHACVLAANSELLYSILSQDTGVETIQLEEFDDTILEMCLNFVYGENIEVAYSNIDDLKLVAERLGITSLSKKCDQVLQRNKLKESTVVLDGKNVADSIESGNHQDKDISSSSCEIQGEKEKYSEAHQNESSSEDEKDTSLLKVEIHESIHKSIRNERSPKEKPLNDGRYNTRQNKKVKVRFDDIYDSSREEEPKQHVTIKTESCESDDNSPTMEPDTSCDEMITQALERTKDKSPRRASRKFQYHGQDIDYDIKDLYCDHCDRIFANPKSLKKHKGLVESADDPYRCSLTGKKKSETPKVYNKNDVYCEHCDRSFANPKSLYNHVKRIKRAKDPNRRSLKRRRMPGVLPKRIQDPEEFYCDHCDRTFASRGSLKAHLRRVNKAIDPNSVMLTGKLLTAEERREKYSIMKRKMYFRSSQCDQCEQVFETYWQRKKHMMTVHEKTYNCKYCNRCCYSQVGLDEHMRRHFSEKPYMCSQCEFRAVSLNEVKLHEEKYHGNSAYHCKECPMVCATRQALRLHERYGHGRRPTEVHNEACSICNKVFRRRGRLYRHMRETHNVEPRTKSRIAFVGENENIPIDEIVEAQEIDFKTNETTMNDKQQYTLDVDSAVLGHNSTNENVSVDSGLLTQDDPHDIGTPEVLGHLNTEGNVLVAHEVLERDKGLEGISDPNISEVMTVEMDSNDHTQQNDNATVTPSKTTQGVIHKVDGKYIIYIPQGQMKTLPKP